MFTNSKPFGPASTFGSSSFGTSSSPFGQSNTAFGAKPAGSNVFGSTAFGTPTPSTGGLFGTTTPSSGTSLFGQPSTAFGQPASTSGGSFGFGSTSTTGGLFGTNTQPTQSSSLFGSTTTSAFGTPRPTFGSFGSTTAGSGLFGQSSSTGTGLFGASKSVLPGSLSLSSKASTVTGFSATPNGTTIKFNPPTGTDTMMKAGVSTNISTRHQCITCMKEYENKSLEELRMEDYAANRKGPQTGMSTFGTTVQTGLFGQPAASTSAFSFGNTTQSKPLFGTTGTSTFGTGTNLFGQTSQPQSTSMFGKPVGFGTATTSSGGAFNFGNITSTSAFGQNNFQKPFGQTGGGTGLFGTTAATTQPSSAFGTGTGFGTFGAGTQQTTGLFGAKPTGFGTTNTTTTNTFTFGTASNVSGGSLFGQKPNVSTFGTGTTGFGTPSTGLGVFGSTQTPTTGLFGQNKPSTGFGSFGSGIGTSFGTSLFSSSMTPNTGTGLFGGSTANKGPGFSFTGIGNTGSTGGGFGQPSVGNQTLGFGSTPAFNFGNDPNASALMQQQLQAQQQILALAANPFGDSPLFRNSIKETNKREEVLKPTNPAAQKAVLSNNQYKVSPLPSAKIKPKPIPLIPNGKVSLFDGLDDEDSDLGNMTFVPKKSVKKLLIKPKLSPHTTSLTVTSNISSASRPDEIILSTSVLLGKPNNFRDASPPKLLSSAVVMSPNVSPLTSIEEPADKILPLKLSNSQNSSSPKTNIKRLSENAMVRSLNSSLDDTFEALHTRGPKQQGRALGISRDSDSHTPCTEKLNDRPITPLSGQCKRDTSVNPIGIVLTRPGYYIVPPLDKMLKMLDEDGNCFVENFTVGHDKYGKVCFPGITNVKGLNIDEIVHFRPKEITVYPDDDDKPPVGEGLNRKAEVTLDCVWPVDKTTHTPIKDPERLSLIGYQEKIEKATKKLNATFIDYKPETGSWVFQVLHFSKYGLEESDEEYEDVSIVPETSGKTAGFASKTQLAVQAVNGHMPVEADVPKNSQMKKQLRLTDHDDEMEDLTAQTFLKEPDALQNGHLSRDFHVNTHQLASVIGVNAERIQGMKASFFQDDMEDNWGVPLETRRKDSVGDVTQMKVLRAVEPHTPQSPAALSRLQPSQRNTSLLMKDNLEIVTPSVTPVASVPQKREVALAFTTARNEILSSYPIIQPLTLPQEGVPMETSISGASRKLVLKPFANSLSYGKQKKLVDMGYFMGRRFRPGWGPSWSLSYLADSYSLQLSGATKSASIFTLLSRPPTVAAQEFSALNVSIGRLQLISGSPADSFVKKNLQESLEMQLENSLVDCEDDAPAFVPKHGVRSLHVHAELSQKHLEQTGSMHVDSDFMKQCCNVWELCVSLWGNIRDLDQEQEVSSYTRQMARREALTKWLIKTSKDRILTEINNSKDNKDYLNAVFCHLTGKQISKACHLAQDSYDHRLALLLSQAGANHVVKRLIGRQLINWEQSKADKFISKRRLKLYALLAGTLVWHSSDSVINCCEDLDWKRSLALHLWYQCHPSSSVQDAVLQYENAFQGTGDHGKYAQPPFPPYIEKNGLLSDLWMTSDETMEQSEPLYDTCFYLLKLYCDRSHRLDKLLMPGASTPAHLDHRLSWLLYQGLSALGYDHLSTDTVSALHCNFASQLETMDMWHWATFVLLHIPDAQRRTKCVKELLLRNLPLSQSEESQERETFLHEKLKVPKEWIFEAKAIKACCLGQPADEAWYLLKAGLWSKSHNIVVRHLAADAIINENYEYLLNYLKELSPPERSSTILDWAIGGQVFLDYIHISQTVENVVKGEVSAYDLEKLQPEVVSLCHRLSSIRCFSARDRLCQAEMAKKTATLLRAVYTLQQARGGNRASLYILAPHINNLPMPEDYTLQEIRAMARGYMQAVASE